MKDFQQTETRKITREMTLNGCPIREIADVCDVSTARIYQHLKKLGMRPAAKAPSVMPRRVR